MTFRPPVIQRREPPRFIPGVNQGRVGSTGVDVQFGGPGQWRTYDWPLPRPFLYPKENRTWIQTTDLFLIGKDVQFGAAGQFKTYDWPLPRAPIYPGPLRTWTLNAQIQLIGKDTFFDGPGKAPTYEWTTRVAPRFIQAPTQGRVTGPDRFFGAPGQAPVYDWPTPKSAVIPGKTWTYSLNQTTLAPVIQANPFFQTDWPLPRTTPYQNSLRTALDWFAFSGLDTFFGAAGQPPANMDWPLPRSGVISGKTWTLSLNQTTLALSLPSPFSQVDWPKPRTTIRLQDYSWTVNLSQSTLAPFIAPMPFNLYDWPTPKIRLPLVDLHSLVQNSGFPDQIPEPIPVPPVVIDIPGTFNLRPRRRKKLKRKEIELLKKKEYSEPREAIPEHIEALAKALAEQGIPINQLLLDYELDFDEEDALIQAMKILMQ